MKTTNEDTTAAPVKRFLNKAEILAIDDLKFEDLFVPEWNAWVRIRMLSASERDHFEAGTIQRNGKKVTTNLENIRARLCLLCMVDPVTGERLFSRGRYLPPWRQECGGA